MYLKCNTYNNKIAYFEKISNLGTGKQNGGRKIQAEQKKHKNGGNDN